MNRHVAIAALAVAALTGTQAEASAQSDTMARRQQRQIDSLTALVRAAMARLDSAATGPVAAPARASGTYMNIGFVGQVDAGTSTNPNVTALQLGDHDPRVRGFTMPNEELAIDAVVDPYFKAFGNIVYKIDEFGNTGIELEEFFALTTSLPRNLQLKAGQFFGEFGRHNQMHPHAWSFVDLPLVLGRTFGPDGMRGQGARLAWLLPTSVYTEATVGVMNSVGETMFSFRSPESSEIHGGAPVDRAVKGFRDLLVVPRLATSLDLTETQTLVAGVSGAFGPNNAGVTTTTSVFGADLYWKWKSPRAAAGFPFVSLQAEGLMRQYQTDARTSADDPLVMLPAETLKDKGEYAQLLWGIKPRQVVGVRGDYVSADPSSVDIESRVDRTRISPNFTWYPTEFSKVRLQYNYDDRKGLRKDHSLWLQFEFTMGAHAAHRF